MFASIRWLKTVFVLALFAITVSLAAKPDRATTTAGLAAWDQVYSVLISPRCINCHTATNYPQQGDDRHRHFANIVRGPEGKGVPGLNCISCHQEENADSTGVSGKTFSLAGNPVLSGMSIQATQPVTDTNGVAKFTVRSTSQGGPVTFTATNTTD